MNIIHIKDVEVNLHPRHNAKYYEAVFKELAKSTETNLEVPLKAVLCNLIILAREFSSPNIHKALIAFKAYSTVTSGISGIPLCKQHPDYISLRKRIMADTSEQVGNELIQYIYPFV